MQLSTVLISAAVLCSCCLLPIAVPTSALKCNQVAPVDVLNHCANYTPSRAGIRTHLQRITTVSQFVVNNASCHPIYAALTQDEINQITGINPPVSSDYALGYAVRTIQECFYPAITGLTHSESLHQMHGQPFNFAEEFRDIEADMTAVVPLLYQLTRSNINLSQGMSCIIPAVGCIQPRYPATRTNGIQFTPGELRLMTLVTIARSTQVYSNELTHLSFWET